MGGLGLVLAGLGAILDRSWVILAGLGAVLRLFWAGWGSQQCGFCLGLSMLFAKSKFRIRMVILAGLEAILGHLGTILAPLGTRLGPPGGRKGGRTGSRRAQGEREPTVRRPPPLPYAIS